MSALEVLWKRATCRVDLLKHYHHHYHQRYATEAIRFLSYTSSMSRCYSTVSRRLRTSNAEICSVQISANTSCSSLSASSYLTLYVNASSSRTARYSPLFFQTSANLSTFSSSLNRLPPLTISAANHYCLRTFHTSCCSADKRVPRVGIDVERGDCADAHLDSHVDVAAHVNKNNQDYRLPSASHPKVSDKSMLELKEPLSSCDKEILLSSTPEKIDSVLKETMSRVETVEDKILGDSLSRSKLVKSEATHVRDAKEENVPPEKMGLFKRFHHTYKQYGKVLVVVHCVTSTVWTAIFYYAAMSCVDVEPALRWLGASDKIVSFYTMPGVGHAAVAYLFYKLATPARYPVTIAGTHLAVKYLRRWGYMPVVLPENTLRSLAMEGKSQVQAHVSERALSVRAQVNEGRLQVRRRLNEQKDEMRAKVLAGQIQMSAKVDKRRNLVRSKMSERKVQFGSKVNEGRSQMRAKYEQYQDKMENIRDELKESVVTPDRRK